MAVLVRYRGTEKAENQALLGQTEEAESGTQWRHCGRRCCLLGQVQESFPALDMAELPLSSEDNKELSGHL